MKSQQPLPTVDEALALVLASAAVRDAVNVRRDDALDLVLAEDVRADLDSPPFDKTMVDGYAVVAADLASGRAELDVLESLGAGATPTHPVRPGAATRIMTGAPIPAGADAVVMVERTLSASDTHVVIDDRPAKTGQNILRQGLFLKAGATVLAAGTLLRPIEIAILAELGRTQVRVRPRPRVAIVATGNELIPADQQPSHGQIRNSNGPMIIAQAARAGAVSDDLGIARDEPGELSKLIARGLSADVLVLSGGVSAGDFDLVPPTLRDLGVEQVFHKLQLKPGKPLWFGVKRASDVSPPTLVFGLPGNPVSTLVCFHLFVRPALLRMAGRPQESPEMGKLATDFDHRSDRPTYAPATTRRIDGKLLVEPVAWRGSADLMAFRAADALIYFPPGERRYTSGEPVEVHML